MVKSQKIFVIEGELFSLYSKCIGSNDLVITASKSLARSGRLDTQKILLVKVVNSPKTRYEVCNNLIGSLEKVGIIEPVSVIVFQGDSMVGNVLPPWLHLKINDSRTPFLVEYSKLDINTIALFKELTVIAHKRPVIIFNRSIMPVSIKLRRSLLSLISNGSIKLDKGIYSIKLKRYKYWKELNSWRDKAVNTLRVHSDTKAPRGQEHFLRKLKSYFNESSLFINGTKFTIPVDNIRELSEIGSEVKSSELEPLTEFAMEEGGKVYCISDKLIVPDKNKCFQNDFLSNEIIFVTFNRLMPLIESETLSEEIRHAYRRYILQINKFGEEALHCFGPKKLSESLLNNWQNIIVFATDKKALDHYISFLQEKLDPLLELLDLVEKCNDIFSCEEIYLGKRNKLIRLLEKPLSSYAEIIDLYSKLAKEALVSEKAGEKIDLRDNLATCIESVPDEDFRQFLEVNYDSLINILTKLYRKS